eukprot:CAMPEP_0170143508 /NCGR_PEP_ID=MMETSP0033_2-20121228/11404_1 /TAXON_ID=195969 /ORGANISM="Dolichomastix tenuilepis, Strain CCMP3274" /LENGTH=235 /DNA_ID=CAMNT_0010379959 /DNA_START=13 /DNA_END=720 /DNA_ORIENTATION=+
MAPLTLSIKDIEREIDVDGDGQISKDEAQILSTLKSMDVDGDGTIGVRELVNLSSTLNQTKAANKQLYKIIMMIGVLAILALGAVFCACLAAVEAGKDTKPAESGLMKTIDGEPVKMQTQVATFEAWQLPAQGIEFVKTVKDFTAETPDGTILYYTITGFEWFSESSIILYSARGDKVVIEEQSVIVTKADGTEIDVNADSDRRRSLLGHMGRSAITIEPKSDFNSTDGDFFEAM